jgi:hypothetical protein
MIPIKDAHALSKLPTSELRREWRRRIVDHDGDAPGTGGIERWLKLAEGVGLDRAYVQSTEGILPGTRFAVEAFVNFVRDRPILEGIASSLTEMFSPGIIADRVRGMLEGYAFVTEEMLAYFTPWLTQAPRDVNFALSYVKAEAHTRAEILQLIDGKRGEPSVQEANLADIWYRSDAFNRFRGTAWMAVPELRAARRGLGRLPVPGLPADRRRGSHGVCALSPDHGLVEDARRKASAGAFLYRGYSSKSHDVADRVNPVAAGPPDA